MKRGALYLAVAALTLTAQVAVAVHSPAFHDEPVRSCSEQAKHFCAERTEPESTPCVFCQVSLNGIVLVRPAPLVSVAESESAPVPVDRASFFSHTSSSHAPRAPPVG